MAKKLNTDDEKLLAELKSIIDYKTVDIYYKNNEKLAGTSTSLQKQASNSSFASDSIPSEKKLFGNQLNYKRSENFAEIFDASGKIGSAKQYSIEQQISQLRKQLNESYLVFTNARDTLSSISFVNIEQKFKQESVILTEKLDSDQLLFDAKGAETTEHLKELNEQTKQNIFNTKKHAGSIAELNTFFRVINQLQMGIKNMEKNHKLMADLNTEVAEAIHEVSLKKQYVNDVKEKLAKTKIDDFDDDVK